MGAFCGPNIVTSGLILDLDIANRKSYMRTIPSSLIDTSAWANGQTGDVGVYGRNGDVTENARVLDTDPWGNTSVVWETRASGNGEADGGWNTNLLNIDRTKLYRFSVWVRRTSATSGGTFYFGTGSNGGVFSTQDSGEKGNPYWDCRGVGDLTQNQWYLVCGFIYPAGTTYTGNHPDSGFYLPGNTVKNKSLNYCNIVSDLKWGPTSTNVQQRVYHYYCGDSTTRLQFADPRIDLCDGSEPTIYELVTNGATMLMDISGYGNHHRLSNGYIPSTNNPKKFTTNGTTDIIYRPSALNGASTLCTIVMWYSTTEVQELWVQGVDTGWYVSASNNNNYYHSNAGTPTNYIDLVAVTNPYASGYKNNVYHMWEAKNVNFSSWTQFNWCYYGGGAWGLGGNVSRIMVYNKSLSAAESQQNYAAMRGRFGI
jgi:hypothetical protein